MFFIIFLINLLFFLFFQSMGIYGGDAGDLVSSAFVGGIAHPPGYPLYSLLGFILSHIPLNTVAWRVGLLSSVPAALTLTLLAYFIRRITHSLSVGFLSAITLGLTYVFWLYAEVPEVFMLLLLFMISAVYIAYEYYETGNRWLLVLLAGVIGLSLTHHHMIVFTFPGIAYIVFQRRKDIQKLPLRFILYIGLAGLVGLIPYMWAIISARSTAAIAWSNPVNMHNLLRLITRADYGSFQSGTSIGQHIQSRFLQIPFLMNMVSTDFTILGCIFAIIGAVALFKKDRKVFVYITLLFLFVGPIFFFYASYLFTTRFQIATAERFVLPTYLFVAIFFGLGVFTLSQETVKALTFLKFHIDKDLRRFRRAVALAIYCFCLILPLSLFYISYPKISILTYDFTSEKLGEDILKPLEADAIVLLVGDHGIFNTQYVYYTEKIRQDVAPLHFNKLVRHDIDAQVAKFHPSVIIPAEKDPKKMFTQFIEQNISRHPIYSTTVLNLPTKEYVMVPMGLVFRIYKAGSEPAYAHVKTMSMRMWSQFHDPLSGSLGKYQNLMQFNVLEYYRSGHMRDGLYALDTGKDPQTAAMHFSEALALDPTYQNAYHFLAEAYIQEKACDKAKSTVEESRREVYKVDESLYAGSMYKIYKNCFKNESEARVWRNELVKYQKPSTVRLEDL